ncbi:hypothetical protein [Marinobacter sp. MIT932201]|uniref:hypothetical protein n=1 Tax=Marinobacter sp. MIT932201 TaxID=3096995 RepID=UPI00399AD9AF
MDNLIAGIWPSPDEKEQSTVSYPAPDVLMGKSGSLPGWQLCRGISGSFRVEWVAGFVWNQWQPWSGIRTKQQNSQLTYLTINKVDQLIAVYQQHNKSGEQVFDAALGKLKRAESLIIKE